jgi:MYXO-CTERM domain-containing protein
VIINPWDPTDGAGQLMFGINDAGDLVGLTVNPSRAVYLTPNFALPNTVPEPGLTALALATLVGAAAGARRRRSPSPGR